MKKYIKITNDVFGVSNGIKKVNKNYFLVFNKQLKRFEVHNKKFAKNPTEFVLPHKQLTKKTLTYVIKNIKKSNSEKIKEINAHNQKIKNSVHTKEYEERNYKLNEIFKYANSGAKEYDHETSYKNVWF